MKESLQTRLFRWTMNWWPCYRGVGARVTFIAQDWSEIRVRLGLTLRTRNYVGSIFGGSLYASVDPFFMLMLIKRLGPGFVVWDKAATIRFRRPGRSTLTATFRIEEDEVQAIRQILETEPKVDRNYTVTLVDAQGTVHAEVDKVVHVRRKDSEPSSGAVG
jgi:acyl-coenzyme A thioesterase PaaI-like protein